MKDYLTEYMNHFYKPKILDDGTEVLDWNHDNSIYHPITDFFVEFSIAERAGAEAVRKVYDDMISKYSDDYPILTELVLVLESKRNEFVDEDSEKFPWGKFYDALYHEAYDYVENHLRDDDDGQMYFYLVTDYGAKRPWLDTK